MSESFSTIPTELLVFSGRNPRTEMRDLEDLAENIRKYGVLQPIVVRPKEEKFEVVVGERRVRATILAGLREVPAIIRPLTDRQADIQRLIENIHRDDLTNAEKGDAVLFLLEYEEFPTIKSVAEEIDKSPKVIAQWVYKAEKLSPFVRDNLARATIGEKQAQYLLKYDLPTQDRLAKKMIEYGLTKRETITFLKLYDENPEGALDDLAEEAKGTKKVEVNIEQLSEKAREEIRKVKEEKTEEAEKKRKEALRRAWKAPRRPRKKKSRKRKETKKSKPPPPLLPDEREELEKYLERAGAKKARDLAREREKRGEFMQAKAELGEKDFSEISLEHSVIVGDARDALTLLPTSSVDLVVTSPPYFDLKEYPDHPRRINTGTMEGYLADLKDIFEECFRVLKDGRFFCIVIGQFTSEELSYFVPAHIARLLEGIGFKYRREHVWVKPLGIQGIWNRGTTSFLKNPFPRNTMINIHHEHILVFQKGDKPEIFEGRNPLTEEEVKQYCWSVWELYVSEIKDHPAPFPEVIPQRLIKMYSYDKEVVLDPFLGSGTCTKVAKELNRCSIGIEISPEYLPLIYLTVGDTRIIRYDKGETTDFGFLKKG